MAYHKKTSLAIYKLSPDSVLNTLRPIPVDTTPLEMAVGRPIYVLGRGDGVHTIQPGYIVSAPDADGFFNHDCQTVPGNAGAPILDLATGRVIGVHWGASRPVKGGGPGIKRSVTTAVLDKYLGRAVGTVGEPD
jgi:hypothetical protein